MCNLSIKLSLEVQNFSALATGSPFCFLKEIRSVSTVYSIMLILEGFQLLDHLMGLPDIFHFFILTKQSSDSW